MFMAPEPLKTYLKGTQAPEKLYKYPQTYLKATQTPERPLIGQVLTSRRLGASLPSIIVFWFVNLKYSNHLNTGPVWYSNGLNMSGCQVLVWKQDKKCILQSKMSGIRMVGLISWPDHLKPDK